MDRGVRSDGTSLMLADVAGESDVLARFSHWLAPRAENLRPKLVDSEVDSDTLHTLLSGEKIPSRIHALLAEHDLLETENTPSGRAATIGDEGGNDRGCSGGWPPASAGQFAAA
jgi:hypothetical protein